jgi:hypothetical protein
MFEPPIWEVEPIADAISALLETHEAYKPFLEQQTSLHQAFHAPMAVSRRVVVLDDALARGESASKERGEPSVAGWDMAKLVIAIDGARSVVTQVKKRWSIISAKNADDRFACGFTVTMDPFVLTQNEHEKLIRAERFLRDEIERARALAGVSPPNSDKKPGKIRVNANDARDAFIYQQRVEGIMNKTICENVNKMAGWGRITTEQGINAAVMRYCKRKNAPIPAYKDGDIKRN